MLWVGLLREYPVKDYRQIPFCSKYVPNLEEVGLGWGVGKKLQREEIYIYIYIYIY